jgi:hypothetical protein
MGSNCRRGNQVLRQALQPQAWEAAWDAEAAWAAVAAAAWAAEAEAGAAYWSNRAIKRIEKAIKERNHD